MSDHSNDTQDGWTTVVGRGKTRKIPLPPESNANDKHLTIADIRRDFDRRMKVWQNSTCRQSVLRVLHRSRPDDGWHISQAVCLATGSFSREQLELRKRSMQQFVAFIDIVQQLENNAESTIGLVVQDPKYTQLDVDFLQTTFTNITTFRKWLPLSNRPFDLGPANDLLGTKTFVFEAFMDFGIQAVERVPTTMPPLYIAASNDSAIMSDKDGDPQLKRLASTSRWQDLFPNSDLAFRTDKARELSNRIKLFKKQYWPVYFPTFDEDPTTFEGLKIFQKIQGEEEEDCAG